jgi:hypothetical protein
MTNEEIKAMAKAAGVRFFGHWIEGSEEAIYKLAQMVVDNQGDEDGVDYYLWPDGTYCERADFQLHMGHMSDDFTVVRVTEWDDDGEPLFPGGLK